LDYMVIDPNLTNPDCPQAAAPICYAAWQTNATSVECEDFSSYFNISEMSKKVALSTAAYNSDATLILVTFNDTVRTTGFTGCNQVLDDATLARLPPNPYCYWTDNTLYVSYSPNMGFLGSLGVKANSLYYDYDFAMQGNDAANVTISLSEYKPPTAKITGPTETSACQDVSMTFTLGGSTLFSQSYTWTVYYSDTGIDVNETLYNDSQKYFNETMNRNSKIITIPRIYLLAGATLRFVVDISLSATGVDTTYANATQDVSIKDNVATAAFASHAESVFYVQGTAPRTFPISIMSIDCSQGNTPVKGTPNFAFDFVVTSGTDANDVTATETDLSKTVNQTYASVKTVTVSKAKGFNFNTYYKISLTATDQNTKVNSTDSIVFYINKPPISSVLTLASNLVNTSSDAIIGGQNSFVPYNESETISYQWKCVGCLSLDGSSCSCPYMSAEALSSSTLVIPGARLVSMTKYTYGLTVTAKPTTGPARSAYNETEFIVYSGVGISMTPSMTTATIDGAKALFLGFSLPNSVSNPNFEWELVSVVVKNGSAIKTYSMMNKFLQNYFKKLNVSVSDSLLQSDTEIPSSYNPVSVTSSSSRFYGVNMSSLYPKHSYTFAATIQDGKNYYFTTLTWDNPGAPRPRNATISPSEGMHSSTWFTITYYVIDSNDPDEASYTIYRSDCDPNKKTLISAALPASGSYSTLLSAGHSECSHEVTLTIRAAEYSGYTDTKVKVTVNDDGGAKSDTASSLLDSINSTSITSDQAVAIIGQVGSTDFSSEPTAVESVTQKVLATIASSVITALLETCSEEEKPALAGTMLNTIAQLTNYYGSHLSTNTLTDAVSQVDTYFNATKSSSAGLAVVSAPALQALSGVTSSSSADRSTRLKAHKSAEMIASANLDALPANAPSTIIPSPTNDIYIAKGFGNANPNSLHSSKGTKTHLPGGMGLNKKTLRGRLLADGFGTGSNDIIGTSMSVMTYNPYSTIKSSTSIDASLLTLNASSNFTREDVASMYSKLLQGQTFSGVDNTALESYLISVTFSGYTVGPDGSQTALSESLIPEQLADGTYMTFELQRNNSAEALNSSNAYIPLFYLPGENEDSGQWINANCTISTTESNDTTFVVNCTKLPQQFINGSSGKLIMTVDSLKNVEWLQSQAVSGLFFGAGDEEKYAIIFSVLCFLIVVILFSLMYFFTVDKNELVNVAIDVMKEQVGEKKPEKVTGIVSEVLGFYADVRNKGILKYNEGEKPMQTERPINASPNGNDAAGINVTIMTTEQQRLKDCHEIYTKLVYKSEEDARRKVGEMISLDPLLARATQNYIEHEPTRDDCGFWQVFKHLYFYINVFAKLELSTPRYLKLLIAAAGILGEFFITGCFYYGYDHDETFSDGSSTLAGKIVVYGICSALLMVPMKIFLSIFLVKKAIPEGTHEDKIKEYERILFVMRIIGIVIGMIWVLGSIAGIISFAAYLTNEGGKNWMKAFGISLGMDLIGLQFLKVAIAFFGGMILKKCCEKKLSEGNVQGLDTMLFIALNYL